LGTITERNEELAIFGDTAQATQAITIGEEARKLSFLLLPYIKTER
jgi:hypothetical protein